MIHWNINSVQKMNILALFFLSNCLLVVVSQPRVINVNSPGPEDKVDILQLRQFGMVDVDGGGQMRNALKSNAHNRWTKYRSGKSKYLIPYVISGSFSQSDRRTIRKAMHSIDKNSCVRFKPRKGEADYVDLQNRAGEGCFTMVGMVRGQNVVMLESSSGATCVTYVTVLHELMHKLGLWHEQMRFDRDKYIRVHWENIPGGLRTQFAKVPSSVSSTYRVPYDYRSAMHYTKNAFANRADKVTMETKKRKYQNVIGNAKKASKGDWTKICGIYKCKRCMGRAFGRGRKSRMEPKLLNGALVEMKAAALGMSREGGVDSVEEGMGHFDESEGDEEECSEEEEEEEEEEEIGEGEEEEEEDIDEEEESEEMEEEEEEDGSGEGNEGCKENKGSGGGGGGGR